MPLSKWAEIIGDYSNEAATIWIRKFMEENECFSSRGQTMLQLSSSLLSLQDLNETSSLERRSKYQLGHKHSWLKVVRNLWYSQAALLDQNQTAAEP